MTGSETDQGFNLEALEPRLLLSADGLASVAVEALSGSVLDPAESVAVVEEVAADSIVDVAEDEVVLLG